MQTVEEIDACAGHQGVHLLVFHRSDEEYLAYRCQIEDHHRISRLPMRLLPMYGTADFDMQLESFAAVEDEWRRLLGPVSQSDPAILPEQFFSADAPFRDLWVRLKRFDGTQISRNIQSLSRNFRVRYHYSTGADTGYKDTEGFKFCTSGPRHGKVRKPMRNWKLGCRLPDGFHYDLTHEKRAPFDFTCRGQGPHTYTTHCNIDAFGYERQ